MPLLDEQGNISRTRLNPRAEVAAEEERPGVCTQIPFWLPGKGFTVEMNEVNSLQGDLPCSYIFHMTKLAMCHLVIHYSALVIFLLSPLPIQPWGGPAHGRHTVPSGIACT